MVADPSFRAKKDTFDEDDDLSMGGLVDLLEDAPGSDSDELDAGPTATKGKPLADDWAEGGDPFAEAHTGTELGGRYRLEKVLGKGACGVVFQASHLIIGKQVALKCLYPALRRHPTHVERFFREARIAATVEHPNVIKIFDGGDDQDTLFLAMELLRGETLEERIARGPMPVSEAVDLFLKIIDGVAAVHEKGVIHRDLKPDNVFLTEARGELEGEPKVLDFGVSKLKEPGRSDLTHLGAVMGTPCYMAPEQIKNAKDVDARADVYSLGVMLYETISGQLPYEGGSIVEIFQAAQRGNATPLDRLSRDVSRVLSKVVHRAMHVEPEKRFPTVRQMHAALAAVRAVDGSGVDSSMTIEDLRSPVASLTGDDLQKLANPPVTRPIGQASDEATNRLRTAQPAVPTWALLALAAMAVLTIGAIGILLFVLLR